MADLSFFDANDVDPNSTFDLIPPGDYKVVVTASGEKIPTNGGKPYLYFELQVIEGDFEGRKLWDRLHINHEKEQTKTFARRFLSSLCHAVGNPTPADTEELHDIPVMAHVKISKPTERYDSQNIIQGYKPADGRDLPKAAERKPDAPESARTNSSASSTGKNMPWKNKRG